MPLFCRGGWRRIKDASRTVPAISALTAEGFWADGHEGYPAKSGAVPEPAPTCCPGVDLPGVGHTHNLHCAPSEPRYTLPTLDADRGQVSPRLAAHCQPTDQADRDYLHDQLIFAGRDLAERSIHYRNLDRPGLPLATIWYCRVCQRCVLGIAPIVYKGSCRVGRVLGLIEDLCDLAQGNFPANPSAQIEVEVEGLLGEGVSTVVLCQECELVSSALPEDTYYRDCNGTGSDKRMSCPDLPVMMTETPLAR